MARVWMRMMMLFSSLFMPSLTFDIQLVKVNPEQAISGVFEASIGNTYALSTSAARDLCERLGLTIASKAQVAEAQKHGLETCRFGWVDEQIAVIPRVQVNSICGNGKTGVVVWRADPSRLFDAFCFNLTDFEASMAARQTTTRKPITTHSSVFPTAQAGVHLRNLPSTSSSLSSPSSSSSSSSSHSSFINDMDDEGKHLPMSLTQIEPVPAALLITVTFAVMLSVFLALYYFKTNRPCRTQCDSEQQKKYIETEVWERCSKKDLEKPQEEHVEENEEEDNNSSSSEKEEYKEEKEEENNSSSTEKD